MIADSPSFCDSVACFSTGWSDQRISEALETSHPTVVRTRRQLVEEGLDAVLSQEEFLVTTSEF